ncbi:MAG: hypothetical protein KDB02_06675 [Acidimicrobiales bacterium]|nr:hypothetical protein [Acidimicrobiales bacterium]
MTSVVLSGRRGGTTHQSIELLATLPPELRLIGGLAVMCRVGTPHRATVDLDALARGLAGVHVDLAALAVSAPGGGQYTFDGDLELDVIDVSPDPVDALVSELGWPDVQLSDLELNVVAHCWAHDTATPLDLVAADELDGTRLAAAPGRYVASALGLVTMKSTTVPLRASAKPEKRASDLYDLGRLIETGALNGGLSTLHEALRTVVAERLHGWFVEDRGRDRTFRDVRRFDDPALDFDDVSDLLERAIAR